MKLRIQIPHGWRKLRVGERLKKGDCWADTCEFAWASITSEPTIRASRGSTFIRRVRTPGRGGKR